ncbi:MAG: hypothetical protein J6U88_01085 [Bacteroidales bacterium]|nr:hypothetical protein [Bacteroidales bacterium]
MEMNVNNSESPLKKIVIALSAVAVVLLGVLIYIWIDRKALIDDLTIEKDQLTEQLGELQVDYQNLSSNNDSLNVELAREREKVEQLIERVKKTEATNRAKIRQYEKELGTLRSIMKHYIVQIDSLNTLNIKLRKDAQLAREQAKKSQAKYEELSKTTDAYAKQIEKGAVVKGRGVVMTAINSSNKETDRSSRVEKLKTCLNLVENALAEKGPRKVYIRVKGPDGILMTGGQQLIFEVAGEQMIYSASREVDYQGTEVEICIYFDNGSQPFVKGVYTVDAYTEEGKLGSADLLLK